MSGVSFLVPDSLKSVFASAGISAEGGEITHCGLQVGDLITFPDEARGLYFRVVKRVYYSRQNEGESEWLVELEQAPNPLDEVEGPNG